MITVLKEQDFKIINGEEISNEKENLYEISSAEESSDEELIFMMTNTKIVKKYLKELIVKIYLKENYKQFDLVM